MKDIEDLVALKIYDIINLALSKILKPDIVLNEVKELDIEKIRELKNKYQIEGIILDVDNTLRRNLNAIPKCNEDWIEVLRGELKVIVLSNGSDIEIDKFFKKRGIEYIDFACKPFKKNFKQSCKKLNLKPEKVLVIGDDFFMDIFGAKRSKMKSALVKNVAEENEISDR